MRSRRWRFVVVGHVRSIGARMMGSLVGRKELWWVRWQFRRDVYMPGRA